MNKTIYTIIFVLAISSFASSCVPVVAAAGLTGVGAGGYYVGTKESDRETMRVQAKAESDALKQVEMQKAAQAAADQGIANQIAMNYTSGKLSNDLAIYPQVSDGVVVLYGRAPSQAVADNAIRIASQQPGVTRIVSNIQVIPAGAAYAAAPHSFSAAQPAPVQPTADQQLQQQIQQQMSAQQPAQPVQYMQPPRSQNPAQIQQQSQMGLVPVALPPSQQPQQQPQPQAQPVPQQYQQPAPQQYQQAPVQQYQQAPQPQSNAAPAIVPLTVYESQTATPATAPKAAPKPIKPMRPAQVSSSSSAKGGVAVVDSSEKPSAKAEQKKNTSVELNEKSKKAAAAAATPPPKKEEPKVAVPKINYDDYHDADAEYTEFTPKAIKPHAQKTAETQQASKPVGAALNIPAPIITDENDLGYIEYKGNYQPNKVAVQKPAPKVEPRAVAPAIVPVAVAAPVQMVAPVQQPIAQPVPVQHVVPSQVPVQQAPVVVHQVPVQHAPVAMPMPAQPINIPTPAVATEDNDSFYEQFYHQ
jgi:osmotically-inducible protein OsmY